MRLLTLCLFFSLCFGSKAFSQFKTFKGHLTDSLGKPVTFGSIIIKYSNEGKVQSSYQLPDNNGDFTFAYNKSWSEVTIEVNSLGFDTRTISIQYNQPAQFNVVLKAASTALKEVSVRANRKVVQKGDTTSFLLDAYSNNNETTVEDIIKKLPGMTVDDNGNIKFNSRPIDKVMVEGEDLFDDNYKMLTKNLSAGVINKIEVIDKFNNNSVLAGITPGDMQVLNLKLKNRNRIVTEGNINLGGGIPDNRYDSKLNLLGISPKFKAILLGSMNNTGEDPFSIIGQDHPEYQRSSNSGSQLYPPTFPDITSVKEYYYPGIDLQRNNFNKARAASLNMAIKPGAQWQIKPSLYIVGDNNTQAILTDVINITSNGNVRYATSNNLNKKRLYQSYNIESTYKPDKNAQLVYEGKYERNAVNYGANISLQDINIRETLNKLTQLTNQRLQFTKRLNNSLALDAEFLYYYNNNPQRLYLSQAFALDTFNNVKSSASNGAIQNSGMPTRQYHGVLRLLGKRNADNFHLNIGYSEISNHFTDFIYGIDSLQNFNAFNLANFNKAYNVKNRKEYIDFLYSYILNTRISIANNTTVAYESLKIDTTTTTANSVINTSYSNIQSRTTFNYKTGNKGGVAFQYRFANRLPQISDLLPSYWIADYRTLQGGTAVFKKISDHNFTLSYNYADYVNAMLLYNGAISYGTNASYYLSNLNINSLYEIVTQVPYAKLNNGLVFASSRIEKYWDKLSGNIFIDANFIHTKTSDQTSDVLTRSVINNITLELGYKSAWDGILNLSISSIVKFNRLEVRSEARQATYTNRYFENRAKLYLKCNEKLNFEIDGEHYIFPGTEGYRGLFFADASARYILKKDKIIFDLSAKNIFDQRSLSFQSVSPLSYSMQQYKLLPGYLMAKFYYRF
ncbi:hypothetical protein LX99_04128 [Mucilaginibacter oryzae]|uniref:Outer membrane receptor protein involved in Fe transport n=1 Tax=Mucilaginibacter oryzae TaxID=468058 RepID=A0A316H3Y3_9SPHI|nr:carboxypeptidase-like regulatory domain-containing protein [Mucilaginibacter oryzae]PWK73743.1 hypothetical protein LX99_04128 [Mucilaginibacter oryzae]